MIEHVLAAIAIIYSGLFGYLLAKRVIDFYNKDIDYVLNPKNPLPKIEIYYYPVLRLSIIYLIYYGFKRFAPYVINIISEEGKVSVTIKVGAIIAPLLLAAALAYLAYDIKIRLNDPLKLIFDNVLKYIRESKYTKELDLSLKTLRAYMAVYLIAIKIALIVSGKVEYVIDLDETIERKLRIVYSEDLSAEFINENKAYLLRISRTIATNLTLYSLVAYESLRKLLSLKNIIIFRPLSLISKKLEVRAKSYYVESKE